MLSLTHLIAATEGVKIPSIPLNTSPAFSPLTMMITSLAVAHLVFGVTSYNFSSVEGFLMYDTDRRGRPSDLSTEGLFAPTATSIAARNGSSFHDFDSERPMTFTTSILRDEIVSITDTISFVASIKDTTSICSCVKNFSNSIA